MKSAFIKTLLLSGLLSPAAFALSLYDTAPPIGLPESYDIRYNVNLSAGYDDNLNSSAQHKRDGGFARFSFGGSASDQDAITRVHYTFRLGGKLYDKNAYGADQQFFSDTSVSASLSHSFGAGSVYSAGLTLSYTPEPDYSNGISAPLSQGECLNWNLNNSYSRAIDSRWSWSANVGYSGNIYTQGEYEVDDRQYITGGLSLSYKKSPLTSYNFSLSSSYDFRNYGHDSQNVHLSAGVNHSLTPVSSVNASLGLQTKFIDGNVDVYPTLRAGYNRKLAEGLSVNSYVSYYNENVDTYRGGMNYLSDATWRVGANFDYSLTPIVSFNFGASLISSSYSKGQGMSRSSEITWSANAGMSYRLTQSLSANVNYTFTDANADAGGYERNVVSAGLSYSF